MMMVVASNASFLRLPLLEYFLGRSKIAFKVLDGAGDM